MLLSSSATWFWRITRVALMFDVHGPVLMVEFQSKPQWRDARHVTPAIQFSTHIIGKQAQIDLVGLKSEDRFRFRAIKSGAALRKVLYQKFAIGIQVAGIVNPICHAVTINVGTA